MTSVRRSATVLITAQFIGLATYFLASPSLERAGYQVPQPVTVLALVTLLTATAVLILLGVVHHQKPSRAVLLFATFPATYALVSLLKGDFEAFLNSATATIVIASLASGPMESARRVYERGISAVVAVSLVLATLSNSFSIVDRDFLPLIIDGRAFGISGHPNTLGLLSGILCISAFARGPRSGWKMMIVSILGLLAAASQTAILSTIVAIVCIIGFRAARRIGPVGTLLFLTLSGLILGLLFVSNEAAAGSSTVGEGPETFTGRTAIWTFLLQQDPGMLGLRGADFTSILNSHFGLGSAHNLYIEAFSRSGYLGLSSVVVSVIGLIAIAFHNRQERTIAIVAYFLVTSVTEGVLLALPLVAVFAALTFSPRLNDQAAAESAVRRRRLPYQRTTIRKAPGAY